MAETMAEMVDNMELTGDSNGDTGAESKTGTDTDTGNGAGDTGDGDSKSGDKSGGEGSADGGQGGDDKGTGDAKDDDSGYVADELEDEGDEFPDDKAKGQTKTPTNLSPELEYVVERLPVLTVRGREGEGAIKSFKVQAAGQLPDNFEFASKKEELEFTQSLASQEYKAQQLLNEYNYKQQQEQISKYDSQENADIRGDIGDLQREGLLPRFQYAPNDRKFNDDPAVKAAQEVIDYMNTKNEQYTKAGKLYRISFRDAFDQLVKQIEKESPTDKAQKQEDTQRRTISRQTGAGKGASAARPNAARPARSMEDLISRIDSMEF